MKRLFTFFLCALLLLTGCLPTPEVEIVPNKGEAKEWQTEAQPYVADAEAATPIDEDDSLEYERQEGLLYEMIGASPTWTMDNTDYGFLITARNCPVYLPDVTAVPVVEAALRSFTQADVDALAAAMFPADTVWYPEVLWTKEELEEMMREVMKEAAAGDPNAAENGHDAKYYEDKLAMYKKRYDEAPYADEIVPTTLEITNCQDDIRFNAPDTKFPGIKVEARVDGAHWKITGRTSADDPLTTYLEATRCADMWIDLEQPLDAPYGVKMTRTEAIRQATAFVQSVAGNEYSVCYCVPILAHAEQDGETATMPDRYSQWGLVFMRTFNGCPTAYAKEEVGGSMDSTVNKPIHYERIEIHIDDQGVSYFRWNMPMTVTGVVSSNARLISFDEAARQALTGIKAKYARYKHEGEDTVMYIARVTFGLWRIQKKGGGWYYVPVYHFFINAYQGTGSWSTTEGFWGDGTPRQRFLDMMARGEYWRTSNECLTFGGDYWGAVTVNALDGTIIDKDKGY